VSNPISFNPFLGWVDATDPNNLPADVRIISAADLLRYENFGVAATTKINAESVRVDGEIIRVDDAVADITGLEGRLGNLEATVGSTVPAANYTTWKINDTTRTSTTTLTNDATLWSPEFGINAVVEVELVLHLVTPVAAGFKFALTNDLPFKGRWGITGGPSIGGHPIPAGTALSVTGTGVGQTVVARGILEFPNAGRFRLQWAQNTSNAGATTLQDWSHLKTRVVG